MGEFEEMKGKTIDAFEESTGQPPSDIERGQLDALVREYTNEEE